MAKKFRELFPIKKPIIGMIHLAGRNKSERIDLALEEISIFEEEGVDGIIVEDYHGSFRDVIDTLYEIQKRKVKLSVGTNFLGNPYMGFELATKFRVEFVQFDNVQTPGLNLKSYRDLRKQYPKISVIGGIRFKYTSSTGNSLEDDLENGISRCEAVVTTGEGTGIETPLNKLREFKRIMGSHPLIVGAGVTSKNVYNQLEIVDGAIVGSYFKNGNTRNRIDRERVKDLMSEVRKLRDQ